MKRVFRIFGCCLLSYALSLVELVPPFAQASSCVDYDQYPRLISTLGSGSFVGACAVDGDHLVTVGEDTLVVYAVSRDPLGLIEVGRTPVPGARFDVLMVDGFAYVATELASVVVVDLSNPDSPSPITSVSLSGFVRALTRVGDRVYAAHSQWPAVLSVLDVSDPSAPALRGSVDDGAPIGSEPYESLAIVGDHAYLTNGTNDLWIVDVAEPSQPLSASKFALPGSGEGVVTDGEWLFVHLGYAGSDLPGLYTLDLSQPTAPTVTGSVLTPGLRSAVTIRGSFVFASCGDAGVQIVDVSAPTQPTLFAGVSTGAHPGAVAAMTDVAFAPAAGTGIHLLELGELSAPIPRHLVEAQGGSTNAMRASVVDLDTGVAYVAAGWLGVVDVSDPFQATTVRNVTVGGLAVNVCAAGEYLYVSMAQNGLRILDTTDPLNPGLRGAVDTPASAQQTVVRDDVAYVCDISALRIVDVSDPDAPEIVRSLETPGSAWSLSASGSVAYLSDGAGGVQVLDLSDPWDPQPVQTLALDGEVKTIARGEHFAFAAASLAGIHVLDLSLPAQIAYRTSFTIPGVASDLALAGDVLYVSNLRGGLHVFDVSNPLEPRSLGGTYVHPPNGITVAGDAVFLASGLEGLNVLPTQCTSSGVPVLLARFEAEVEAWGVRLRGALSDPWLRPDLRLLEDHGASPREIPVRWEREGFVAEDRGARGQVDYRLLVRESDRSWRVLAERRVSAAPPSETHRLEVGPNPFNPRTVVRFLAPEGEWVRLEVLDLRGRRVEELFRGPATGREQSLRWEPRALASGVYLLRLEAPGRTATRRVTLVE